MSTDQVLFVDYQRPVLPSDDYTISVTQTVDLDPAKFTTRRTFTVAGERFALPPDAIQAQFPPDGSMGDHGDVLPHVVLRRATLPWERSPDAIHDPADPAPWLCLLLFAGAEQPVPQVLPTAGAVGAEPYLPVPSGRPASADEKVTVIDVPRALLETLLPARAELPLLAHVRRTGGQDVAVVVGNRLPSAGVSSTVHLVSLEGRYASGRFDFGPGGANAHVRLVSLASWRFACLDQTQTFGTLAGRLHDAGAALRLAGTGDPHADAFLQQGHVPVRHLLRGGGRSVAWYRGPLLIGPPATAPVPAEGAVRTADQLLRYHPEAGVFDVSHAAAWELGRLLALRSSAASATLHAWKSRRDRAHKRGTVPPGSYPLEVAHIDAELPATLVDWLTALARLDGVPFTYLVPDERLLPAETVRFFHLDQEWMRHLLDGAYSLGRVTSTDAELDGTHPLPIEYPTITGAILRSEIVSGYPGLLVDGFADEHGAEPLERVRLRRLGPSVLLCLFNGNLGRLDLHQQPEALHFGLELRPDNTVTRRLRGPDEGTTDAGELLRPVPLGRLRTVPVRDLAAAMAATLNIEPARFTAGALARQLIETGERVSYIRAG
jgi:hypothetical protein